MCPHVTGQPARDRCDHEYLLEAKGAAEVQAAVLLDQHFRNGAQRANLTAVEGGTDRGVQY